MKKILFYMSALVLFLSLASCSKEEIDMYNQNPRINFDYRTVYSELRDSDYVKMKTDPYRRDSVRVRIMGDLLTANRDFCIKKTDNSSYANTLDIQLDDKYTYSALDTVCQYVYFKVKRPAYKTGRKAYGCNLEFDLTNPNHQFEKGFIEDNSVEVNYVWDITEPETWGDWYWLGVGEFSPIKYCYMMDVWGRTLDSFITSDGYAYDDEEADAAIQQLDAAYKAYKAEHGPILDENGKDIFPDEEE